jgi:hypothetical protein
VAAFAHVIGGLTKKSLGTQMEAHWREAFAWPRPVMTCDCCNSRPIERIEEPPPAALLSHGLRIAAFFTQLANRVIVPAPTDLADLPGPLRRHRARSRPPGAPTRGLDLRVRRAHLALDPKLASSDQSETVKWIYAAPETRFARSRSVGPIGQLHRR